MADTKISALPASTVPLAGTEVLPIVQSGTTKQVSVANLTAGRAISATQLTLTTGNLIVASGQGIDFSATPGTGTSELLADYEEGNWTPTVRYSTSDGDLAYSVQVGSYVKVGSVVTCVGYLLFSESTASGDLFIGGLPFTTKNTTNLRGGFGLFVDNLVLTVGGISGMFLENKTEFGVYYSGTGTETQVSNTNTVAGSNVFRFVVTYIAA